MNKYIHMLKNIGILTIGQLSSKILVFLLVPLYTSVLSLEEYGSYDLLFTTVSLLMPILTLNITVSAQRFLLDQNNNKAQIIKTTLKYTFIGILFAVFLILANGFCKISEVLWSHSYGFIGLFIVLALNSAFTEITIGLERVKDVAISGVLSTFSTIILNIVFLLIIKWGLTGYFIANIIGPLTQSLYLLFRLRSDLSFRGINRNKSLEKQMLNFSAPQIINTVSWWINNASDRYIVTYFCGIAINGVYSVAYKIPAIINVLGGVFSQATTISIVKNFESEDNESFFSNVYNAYNFFLVITGSLLIVSSHFVAKFMYAKEFFIAWKYCPVLILASLFGALAGYLGGAFSAKLASKEFSQSTLIGAVTNVVLNLCLVPFYGAMGAAVATCISYVVIWAMRLYRVSNYLSLRIKVGRDIAGYVILLVQGIVLNICKLGIGLYILEMVLFVGVLALYWRELFEASKKLIYRKVCRDE